MLTSSLVVALSLAAEPAYEAAGTEDGITIEKRAVPGSGNAELRLTTTTKTATVDALCDAAWGDGSFDPTEPDLKGRTLLAADAGWRLTYEQIAPAVVSPRDYALSMEVARSERTCVVRYRATPDGAPAKKEGWVRLEKVWGSWTFDAQADGSVRVVYVNFSDPAGSIPSFLVEGSRKSGAVKWLKRVVSRASAARASAAREGGTPTPK